MSLVILNFHGVGRVPRSIDSGEYGCWLDQDFFEAVLDLIIGHPNIRITVDDGNESDYTLILPALRRRNLTATFFICSGRLGKPTFLNQEQLVALSESGMNIGSHGVDHVSWRKLSSPALSHELQASRSTLQKICKQPIDSAACPFGEYNRTVLQKAKEAGYKSVFTSDGGAAKADCWLLARNTVTRKTPIESLRHLTANGPTIWEQTKISARTLLKRLR